MTSKEYAVEAKQVHTNGSIEWVRLAQFWTLDTAVSFCDRRHMTCRVVLGAATLYRNR